MAISTAEVHRLAYESKEKATEVVEVLSRLHRWKNERPLLCKFFERRARKRIFEAAIADLLRPSIKSPEEMVQLMTRNSFARLDMLLKIKGAGEITIPKRDTITKEDYIVRFRREAENTLVAEEVTQAGSVISQARISSTGKADLTLNFTGERYTQRDANPNISVDSHFPRATATVFNFLVGTAK